MTLPAYSYPPPPVPPERKPRWWLVGIVVAWAVVLVVGAVWSIRNEPATVPDQRSIKQALPYLQKATAAMLTAADGAGRAVVLGDLVLDPECHLTPVRPGVQGSREVTVHVRSGQLGAAFDAIAAALPAGFKAQAKHGTTGGRHDLYADAGGFVAIDATARADDTVFTLRASTGCRPRSAGFDAGPADPPAGSLPPAYTRAVGALGAGGAAATERVVTCPGGATARTVISGELTEPRSLGTALEGLAGPAAIVQADPHDWAYRDGDVSVVVDGSGGHVRVSATTACR